MVYGAKWGVSVCACVVVGERGTKDWNFILVTFMKLGWEIKACSHFDQMQLKSV